MDWEPIIWTIIWVVVGLVALGIVAWVVVASLAARAFKKTTEEFHKDFREFPRRF